MLNDHARLILISTFYPLAELLATFSPSILGSFYTYMVVGVLGA
jgi:hypothetical protein